MRKFYSMFLAVFVTAIGYAQAPQKMSYQAVIRNNLDELVTNHAVGMKISILKDAAPVFVETQTPTSDANGLVTIEIGGGTPVTGTLEGIDWSAGTYFIKTETDPTGGTSYTITGTSQLLSVPYALFAQKAHDIDYNFIITGISNLTMNKNETMSIPIYIHWIGGEQENVALSATDVPNGVNLQFEESDGKPDFASSLSIEVTRDAMAGIHTLSVIGTAESGRIRVYSFELNIVTNLCAELMILDATSWTVEDNNLKSIQGAIVKLFASQSSFDNNLPDYTALSDENGMIYLYDLPALEEYLMLVEKDDLSNIVDGYLIQGVFNNQAEIDTSPFQTGAYVGGLKFIDYNGDGVINVVDKAWRDHISIFTGEVTTKTIIIGK